MAREAGTKVMSCPNCGETIVVVPGKSKECRHCGHKFKVTKALIASQKK